MHDSGDCSFSLFGTMHDPRDCSFSLFDMDSVKLKLIKKPSSLIFQHFIVLYRIFAIIWFRYSFNKKLVLLWSVSLQKTRVIMLRIWYIDLSILSLIVQMIDDQDLGFFANFLGIFIFVLVIAYHFVMADPKYESNWILALRWGLIRPLNFDGRN